MARKPAKLKPKPHRNAYFELRPIGWAFAEASDWMAAGGYDYRIGTDVRARRPAMLRAWYDDEGMPHIEISLLPYAPRFPERFPAQPMLAGEDGKALKRQRD